MTDIDSDGPSTWRTIRRVDDTVRDMHDKVLLLVDRTAAMASSMDKVELRLAKNNGIVADILEEQHEQRGTLSAMKWIATTLIAVTGIGVAVAGVVLAIVARGG